MWNDTWMDDHDDKADQQSPTKKKNTVALLKSEGRQMEEPTIHTERQQPVTLHDVLERNVEESAGFFYH